jgi:GNAT superfamily N-acetyltransferase
VRSLARLTPRLARASFEDVPEILRVIERALEHGSARHYRPEQRRAIHLGYASAMFLDVVTGFQTIVAERRGELVGMAQLDPVAGRLRALFVDGSCQGEGIGRLLLGHVEALALDRGCSRLRGAMSLNAEPFYARAGFRRCDGPGQVRHFDVSVPVVPMEKILRR